MLAVRVRAGGASATVERLLAPSLRARTSVTIGGQSLSATSTTAVPSGHAEIERVARWRGAYHFRIPGASAVLLTIASR
jgi:hypothetical protein